MNVLVTGATGKQGGAVARHLLLRGNITVHALVRNPSSAAAQELQQLGARLIEGSFDDIPSLQQACQNQTAVFLNVSPSFRNDGAEVEHANNVITAARAARVSTLVYPSVCGIDQHESFPGWNTWSADGLLRGYFGDKLTIEERVRTAGFANWTILRPASFMTNYLGARAGGLFPELVHGGGIFRVALGAGKRTMLISPDDIGQVAAAAMAEPARFRGRAIDLGAEALTVEEVARALAEVSGREIRVEIIPEAEAEELAKTNVQVDIQRWFWERQAQFDPRQVEAEFGVQFTRFREFLQANEALVKETLG